MWFCTLRSYVPVDWCGCDFAAVAAEYLACRLLFLTASVRRACVFVVFTHCVYVSILLFSLCTCLGLTAHTLSLSLSLYPSLSFCFHIVTLQRLKRTTLKVDRFTWCDRLTLRARHVYFITKFTGRSAARRLASPWGLVSECT